MGFGLSDVLMCKADTNLGALVTKVFPTTNRDLQLVGAFVTVVLSKRNRPSQKSIRLGDTKIVIEL